jgi:pimeloyl-ACP methyl ester carboxylesterase
LDTQLTIYCIPGVGANERLFERLHIAGVHFEVVMPIMPEYQEPLAHYVNRFLEYFPSDGNIWILGQSFGGMLGQEIAKVRPNTSLIITNSFQDNAGLSKVIQWAGSRPEWINLIPSKLLNNPKFQIPALHGSSSKQDDALVAEMLASQDPEYLRWAIWSLLQWKPKVKAPIRLILEGGADYVTPPTKAPGTIQIAGGGHIMAHTHSQAVSEAIQKYLEIVLG